MSRKTGKHQKPRYGEPQRASGARHRKPSPIATVLQQTPVRLTAAGAGLALTVSVAAPATIHWMDASERTTGTGLDQAAALRLPVSGAHTSLPAGTGDVHGRPAAETAPLSTRTGTTRTGTTRTGTTRAHAVATPHPRGKHHAPAATQAAAVYLNPLRDISGLIPERVDMGVDFGGSGPIFALGDAVITQAQGDNGGWPGGGWITYQLTDGPAAGLIVYVAENVTPTVSVGEHVTSSTVIANMYNGGDGIETGWAMPDSASAESQLAVAGGISGGGPFPTDVGLNFEELLQAVGVPAANNWGQAGNGLLPSNYPADWSGALHS